MSYSGTSKHIRAYLCAAVAEHKRVSPQEIDTAATFASLGLGSLEGVQLAGQLQEWLGREVPPTVFWDHPSIDLLGAFLAGEQAEDSSISSAHRPGADASVGVMGMACRFPGARTPEALWSLLQAGESTVKPVSQARWPGNPGTDVAGLLDDVQHFDPAFFGISMAEAVEMDPQQRLLLEVTWEALENAGIPPASLQGSRTGVFIGISSFDYRHTRHASVADANVYAAAGGAHSIAANRISYVLNLCGPSLAVDTACSSSLVAMHLAARSLQNGDCDLAIVGGVNILLDPGLQKAFSRAGMLAPDGRCKAYDDQANGYVRGEGCGVVVLRRLDDVDDERPLALLRASCVNQDGRSNGLFAPNGEAQVKVIREALGHAGLMPTQISYLEGHGTGTRLGDAIELNAVRQALRPAEGGPALHIGSLKANIGHLEAAAGMAGFIKTVLVLQHRTVPPLRLTGEINQVVRQVGMLRFPTASESLALVDGTLYAAVSSFGFGGTNAHAILEMAPRPPRRSMSSGESARLLVLSARDGDGLRRMAARVKDALGQKLDKTHVADLCHSLAAGRQGLTHRLALSGADGAELLECLNAWIARDSDADAVLKDPARRRRTAWQFAGQGAQWRGMGRAWYGFSRTFRETLEHVCAIAQPHLDVPLLASLLDDSEDADQALARTAIAQPAMFCMQWSLAQAVSEWLPAPDLLTGHSLGFYAAACRAGAMSLEYAVSLVCRRGACFEQLAGHGQSVVVFATPQVAMQALGDLAAHVDVAIVNAPGQCLLACPAARVPECMARWAEAGLQARVFNERYAFHSRMAQPSAQAFAACLEEITFQPTRIDLVCDRTGDILPAGTVLGPTHWLRHAVEPVRFDLVHQRLAGIPVDALLEIGPGATLSALAVQNNLHGGAAVPLLPRKRPAWPALLDAMGQLFLLGVDIDWRAFGKPHGWRRVPVPNYPFAQERCWLAGHFDGVQHQRQGNSMTHIAGAQAYADVLTEELARMLRTSPERIDRDANLLDIGADSIILMGAVEFLETRYGVRLPVSEFFTTLNSIQLIAEHLERVCSKPAEAAFVPSPALAPVTEPSGPGQAVASLPVTQSHVGVEHAGLHGEWQRLFERQLEAVSNVVREQIHALGRIEARPSAVAAEGQMFMVATTQSPARPQIALAASLPPPPVAAQSAAKQSALSNAAAAAQQAPAERRPAASFMPFPAGQEKAKAERNDRQQAYMARFVPLYNQRTAGSKAYAARHRPRLADNRMVSGFRLGTKSMVYPIVASRAQGPHIWDVDGNRYLDLTMGFGVSLFGHNPPFLKESIAQGEAAGFTLGPQSDLAGEVATLLCDITGHERATFANTGSEAVMLALRLARAETGRPLVVLFGGAYHGTADTVMARPGATGALPFAPGITANQIHDLVILEYGDSQSLNYVRENAERIAAVLVEPVQSRSPQLQPRAFLHELREITRETGVALVFDEVLNGFRIHLRGGQGYYGIEADLAAYGKIMGGGLPIGAVAGKARYLDHIDGGQWDFGNDSYPAVPMTFFAGTFCKHPLALRAAHASLHRLKHEGEAIIERTNARTSAFVAKLNAACCDHGVKLRVEHCGSLFRFPQIKDVELLHYALIQRGLYIWEGRNCFLSEAHEVGQLDEAAEVFREVVGELAAHGFLGVEDSRFASPAAPSLAAPVSQVPGAFPLSVEQEQLLALFHLGDPRWDAYNVAAAVQIPAPMDAAALQRAVDGVMARHEALRSRVLPMPGQALQGVLEQARVAVQVEAVSSQALEQHMAQAAAHRFDPYEEPPLRAHLLRVDDQRCVLLLVMHHLWVDGWSAGLILEEVLRAHVDPASLSKVPYSYRRFLDERRSRRQGVRYAQMGERTRAALLGGPQTAPAFPITATLQADNSKASQVRHVFAGEDVRRLRSAAKSRRMTLYQMMLGAYALAVHRVSGAASIRLAMALGGREGVQEEALVGYCSNLCVMPLTCQPGASAWSYAESTRAEVLEAMARSDYGHADWVNDAHQAHRPGSAAVDLVFNLEHRPDIPDQYQGALRWLPVSPPAMAFPQFVNLVDDGSVLQLCLDYRTEVPGPRVIEACRTVLAEMMGTSSPDGGRDDPPPGLVGRDEEVTRPAEACASPSTLAGGLLSEAYLQALETIGAGWLADILLCAKAHPERVALRHNGADTSYQALVSRAFGIAHALHAAGCVPGTAVGVCLAAGVEMVSALLGTVLAGGHYVPLDAAYPPQRVADCIADANVAIVIATAASAGMLPVGCMRLDPAVSSARAPDAMALPSPCAGLAYLIHTSGSTGKPKGVAIGHASLTLFLRGLRQRWGIGAADRFLNLTSISFDIAALELFLPLVSGGRCVVASQSDRIDGSALSALIEGEGVTVVQATPSSWRLLLDAGVSLAGVRIGGVGGEPPPRPLFDRIRAQGVQAWNLYGPTEATIWACVWLADDSPRVVLGCPLDGVEAVVLKDDGTMAGAGEAGELMLGGACLAQGYWRRPGLTADRFVPHPHGAPGARLYRTGDVVRVQDDGQLVYLNRTDGQVKLRGYRIELGEIEHHAQKHPAMAHAVCTLNREGPGGPALVLHVLAQDGVTPDERAMRHHLAKHLPHYMLPQHIRFVSTLPQTLNGKVDRAALATIQIPGASSAAGTDAAGKGGEQLLQAMLSIWQEAIGLPDLNATTDFYDAGGYSLKAARIIAMSKHRLGLQVHYEDIVQQRTVQNLVEHLQARETVALGDSVQASPARPADIAQDLTIGQVLARGDVDDARTVGASAPVRKRTPLRKTPAWRHHAFVTIVTLLHIPAIPLIAGYGVLTRLLPPVKPALRSALPRFLARCLVRAAGATIRVDGIDRLCSIRRPMLIVANHNSRFDAYLLMSTLPFAYKNFGSDEDHVTRDKLAVFAWAERTFDLSFTHYKKDADRTEAEMDQARQYLASGGTVLMFPEGGFGSGTVDAVGDACVRMACDTGALIVPVGLRNSADLYESNGYRYAPAEVEISVGRPIDVLKLTGTSYEVADLIRKSLQSLVDQPSQSDVLCQTAQRA